MDQIFRKLLATPLQANIFVKNSVFANRNVRRVQRSHDLWLSVNPSLNFRAYLYRHLADPCIRCYFIEEQKKKEKAGKIVTSLCGRYPMRPPFIKEMLQTHRSISLWYWFSFYWDLVKDTAHLFFTAGILKLARSLHNLISSKKNNSKVVLPVGRSCSHSCTWATWSKRNKINKWWTFDSNLKQYTTYKPTAICHARFTLIGKEMWRMVPF